MPKRQKTKKTMVPRKRKGKRGPPATGKGISLHVRVQPPEMEQLEDYAAAQPDKPTLPIALLRKAGLRK